MNDKLQHALNQSRKLQERLERLHDNLNDKFGPSNELTILGVAAYCVSFGIMCDLEALVEGE